MISQNQGHPVNSVPLSGIISRDGNSPMIVGISTGVLISDLRGLGIEGSVRLADDPSGE